jgi:hypothetical protein
VDAQDTLDVEVPPADVVPSSTDLSLGEVLTVSARVRNRGTASIAACVILARHRGRTGRAGAAAGDARAEHRRGAHVCVTASVSGDPLPLAVIADPFRLFDELSEANNRADRRPRAASALPNLAVSAADIHFAP